MDPSRMHPGECQPGNPTRRRSDRALASLTAFSRLDLVVTLAVVTTLASLTLAAIPGSQARRSICLNNHRQLTAGWLNYAIDHDGTLPGNLDGGTVETLSNSNVTWVLGWLDNSRFVPANTNVLCLTDYSPLAPYLARDPRPFRCPADPGLTHGAKGTPRFRSVSLNSYMGRNRAYTSGFRMITSLAGITRPSPSQALTFIDEREDSINDGSFLIDMYGSSTNPTALTMVDYPADWHDRGCTLSFADGHTEVWTWMDPRTMPTHRRGLSIPLSVSSPTNVDILRIQAVATSKSL